MIIEVTNEADIIFARQIARQVAIAQGLSMMDQSRVATAVSELARNIAHYADRGNVTIRTISNEQNQAGIEILVEDEGPGIPDLEQALQPGFSSGNGLGLGLSGTKRLMDEMMIESRPGEGTRVVVRKWRR